MGTIRPTGIKILHLEHAFITKVYMKNTVEKKIQSPTIKNELEELPPDILAALFKTSPITKEDMAELGAVNRDLNFTREFQADLLSGYFLHAILGAMREDGVNGSELARRLGKSRQNVSQLLNEENRRNFTLVTMAEIALALNRMIMPIELFNPVHQMKFVFPEGQTFIKVTLAANLIQPSSPVNEPLELTQNEPTTLAA
jgi:hypothetical protein